MTERVAPQVTPPAAETLAEAEAPRPAALLRGGARGLEFLIWGRATVEAIAAALCTRLAEAPAFFRGNTVRVRVEDGPLPPGCLGRLDDIAARFELRILEVGPVKPARAEPEVPQLAAGSAGIASPLSTADTAPVTALAAPPAVAEAEPVNAPEPAEAAEPAAKASEPPEPAAAKAAEPSNAEAVAQELVERLPAGETRIVVGPVRSGVILDHPGNLVVVGDVNPGAEVRAERNIIVLGRLRGIAHAGIGRSYGFILALKLEPQQLRIARQVARAGDADGPAAAAEIAYVTSNKIVVERYAGKLPVGLGNSM